LTRIGRKALRRADRRAAQCLFREFRLTSCWGREAASSQLACRRGVGDLRRSGVPGRRCTHWGEYLSGRAAGGGRRGLHLDECCNAMAGACYKPRPRLGRGGRACFSVFQSEGSSEPAGVTHQRIKGSTHPGCDDTAHQRMSARAGVTADLGYTPPGRPCTAGRLRGVHQAGSTLSD
jgi:hypothetical protein